MYEKIERWYRQGLWTAEMVRTAADKGVITQAQANEIMGEDAGTGGGGAD